MDSVNLTNEMRPRCKYGDPYCPCQDGDQCHYEGVGAWSPRTRPITRRDYVIAGLVFTVAMLGTLLIGMALIVWFGG